MNFKYNVKCYHTFYMTYCHVFIIINVCLHNLCTTFIVLMTFCWIPIDPEKFLYPKAVGHDRAELWDSTGILIEFSTFSIAVLILKLKSGKFTVKHVS